MHSVYALCDPRTGDIRYIGQTIDIHKRYAQHLLYSSEGAKKVWLDELKSAQLLPTITVLESNISDDQISEREMYWIAYYLERSCDLTNITLPAHRNPQNSERQGTIRKLLREYGFTMREVAHAMGIPESTLHHWASHNSIPKRKRIVLSKILGCDVQDLAPKSPENLAPKSPEKAQEPNKQHHKNLRALIKDAGMYMREIAEITGIPESTLHYWASHKQVVPQKYRQILAQAIGCDIQDLARKDTIMAEQNTESEQQASFNEQMREFRELTQDMIERNNDMIKNMRRILTFVTRMHAEKAREEFFALEQRESEQREND